MPRKKKNPLAPLPLLRESLVFMRRQPVAGAILAWLFILPATLQYWAERTWEARWGQELLPGSGVQFSDLSLLILSLFFTFLTLWGMGCALFLGKRMVQSKAGRSRSSFRRTSVDALPLVLPLLLTSLLQQCFVFYRSLLYLIPTVIALLWLAWNTVDLRQNTEGVGFIILILSPLLFPALLYAIRTSLFAPVLACEGLAYRAALRRSLFLTRGYVPQTFLTLLALAALTLLPAFLLSFFLDFITPPFPALFPYALDIVHATLFSSALLLFTMTTLALYGKLKEMAPKMREVKPED